MKNLKKIILKNKTVIILLFFVAVLCLGVFLYIDRMTNTVVDQSPVSSDSQNNQTTDEQVADNVANKKAPEDVATGVTTTTPQSSNATDIASSVSLQGVMDQDSQSAYISLYGMAAYYTVEKKVDETWTPLKTNVFYEGRNGLEVDILKSNSSSLEYFYRIYPVIDGVKSSQYSEVVINWNLLVSEKVKSFPGGL